MIKFQNEKTRCVSIMYVGLPVLCGQMHSFWCWNEACLASNMTLQGMVFNALTVLMHAQSWCMLKLTLAPNISHASALRLQVDSIFVLKCVGVSIYYRSSSVKNPL